MVPGGKVSLSDGWCAAALGRRGDSEDAIRLWKQEAEKRQVAVDALMSEMLQTAIAQEVEVALELGKKHDGELEEPSGELGRFYEASGMVARGLSVPPAQEPAILTRSALITQLKHRKYLHHRPEGLRRRHANRRDSQSPSNGAAEEKEEESKNHSPLPRASPLRSRSRSPEPLGRFRGVRRHRDGRVGNDNNDEGPSQMPRLESVSLMSLGSHEPAVIEVEEMETEEGLGGSTKTWLTRKLMPSASPMGGSLSASVLQTVSSAPLLGSLFRSTRSNSSQPLPDPSSTGTISTERSESLGDDFPFDFHDLARYFAAGIFQAGDVAGYLSGIVHGPNHASTGFVTLKSLFTKASFAQMLVTDTSGVFDVNQAPEARDIIWLNVTADSRQSDIRHKVTTLLLFALALSWTAVVRAMFSLQDRLRREYPVLDRSSFANYLSVAMLLFIIQALPFVIYGLAYGFEKKKSFSAIHEFILKAYFWFQVINVYVTVTSDNIFTTARSIALEPSKAFTTLGIDMALVATYACSIIVVKVFTGLGLYLLQPVPLIKSLYVEYFTDTRRRTEAETIAGAYYPRRPWYGGTYPDLLLVMLLVFLYQILAPFVVVAAVAFFLVAPIVFKYLLLYVYIPQYESGGASWYPLYWTLITCLVISHVTLSAYLFLKEATLQGVCLVPLPFVTLIVASHINNIYHKSSESMAIDVAVYIDSLEKSAPQPIWEMFHKSAYEQPELAAASMKLPAGLPGEQEHPHSEGQESMNRTSSGPALV
ncbi:unnamed protein product [Chrysoparadoxa australica]